ncbi:hypothetical protein ACM74F_20865 [Pseudomonas aeruginosa]
MRVKNVFIFTVGLKGCSPIPSVLGIYHKHASRSEVKFIGWYHLSAKRSQSDIQEIFSNNSDEPLKGFEVLEAEAVTRHATEDIHTPDLSTLQGDAGAIILAHGGGAQAGSSSAEAVAKAVADFRKKTKLPMQFRKIVFDVCNMASPIKTVTADQGKFSGIGFYDSEGNAIAKSKEFQLNFLQAFTAIYGALTHDAGSVKVAGWDSGISVFHPANEYVMGSPAPANGWTATVSNRELVATLKHGQKFLSNRISDEENSKTTYTLKLIDNGVRASLKKTYQYVSVQNEGEKGKVIQTKLEGWSDKEL